MTELELLQKRVQHLESLLSKFIGSDRYTIQQRMQFLDGMKIQAGTTTGLIIGSTATEKIGFFGQTGAIQQTSVGALTANFTYTNQERYMIQTMYDAIRAYGLLS